jgi:small-conductance mechanosensitive channel
VATFLYPAAVLLLSWLVPAATAQEPAPAADEPVPVVVRGDTLFFVYRALGQTSAAERAESVERRIRWIGADPLALEDDSLRVVDGPGVTRIVFADLPVATITDEDAAAVGMERSELAARHAEVIASSIQAEVSAALLRATLLGVLYTFLATAGLLLVLYLLSRAFPLSYTRIESWGEQASRRRRGRRIGIFSTEWIAHFLIGTVQFARAVLTVVVLYLYAALLLSFFPLRRDQAAELLALFNRPFIVLGTAIVETLPNLLPIGIIVALAYYVTKLLRLFFRGVEDGGIVIRGFHTDWAPPTYKLLRFVVIASATVAIWPYIPGSTSPAFAGIAAFLALLVSFGSASSVASVISGLVLSYMRAYQVGDRVRIADTVGDVIERTLLVTRVRTDKNVEITVPNAKVLDSHVVNYSALAADPGAILHTTVPIGYGVPSPLVEETLLEAARQTEHVLREPAPFVLQEALTEFHVDYQLNVFTARPDRMEEIYSELHRRVRDHLNDAGIEITSPHYLALRDGNRTTIPENYLPRTYRAPGFRVTSDGNHGEGQEP